MAIEVAAAQIPISWNIQANLAAIEGALREARGAQVVVLPEAAISGYDAQLSGLATLDAAAVSRAIDTVAAAAVDQRLHVFCGSLLAEGGRWWNAAVHFSPDGRRGIYRKVNLATAERGRLSAGGELPVFTVDAGTQQIAVGCQICRELRFPEQWHALARSGAQLLAYLTHAADAGAPAGVWRSHLVSRAAETQRFVLAANVCDPDQHCPTMIVSPRGEVVAQAPPGASCVVRATVDAGEVADWYLSQQREDVVRVTYRPVPPADGR